MPHGNRKPWLLTSVFVLLLSLLLLAGCTTSENKTDASSQTETVTPDQTPTADSGGEAAKPPAGAEVDAESKTLEAAPVGAPTDQAAEAADSPSASKESGGASSAGKESKADSSSQTRMTNSDSGTAGNAAGTKSVTPPDRKEGASAGSSGTTGTSGSVTKASNPAKTTTGAGSSSSEGDSSASTSSSAVQKGGSTEPAAADSEAVENAVTLSIAGDEETGTIMPATSVELQAGDTALEVLKRVARSNGIQMEYKGAEAVAYIEGIDNLYEFDHGPKSGWMFRINGQFPSVGAGAYTLKAGDRIEWLYTLDLGADIGAKSN
jgi:hypothetical protein